MTSSVPIGFLNVRQCIWGPTEGLGAYDLAVNCISWEARSLAALPILRRTTVPVKGIRFASSASVAAQKDEHAKAVLEALGTRGMIVEMAPSLEFDKNVARVEALVRERYVEVGRPIRLLLDMSCLPKRYVLFLLGMGFKREYVSTLDILYAEGKYSAPSRTRLAVLVSSGLVSVGEWSSVQVPFLEAKEYAPTDRDLVIAVGAEISAAVPLIERMDPRRLRLIEISGSEKRVPKAHLQLEKRALAPLLEWPNCSRQAFELHDIVGVARSILADRQRITTCLAISSKPHALAFGLAALADDSVDVVCRAPKSYAANDVQDTGIIYRFTLEDRFEPLAYWHSIAEETSHGKDGTKKKKPTRTRSDERKRHKRAPASGSKSDRPKRKRTRSNNAG